MMGTGSFPEVKRPGRGVDHPPLSSAEVKKESRAIPLLLLWAFMACSRVNFTFTFIVQRVGLKEHLRLRYFYVLVLAPEASDRFRLSFDIPTKICRVIPSCSHSDP
jgi:hypothetical protein